MNNPIDPIEREPVIVPQDRWRQVELRDDVSALTKTYKFLSPEQKVHFVADVLYYELQTQHNAKIVIEKDEVTITVSTSGIDVVTELDKSYAVRCDVYYRDVVYNANV